MYGRTSRPRKASWLSLKSAMLRLVRIWSTPGVKLYASSLAGSLTAIFSATRTELPEYLPSSQDVQLHFRRDHHFRAATQHLHCHCVRRHRVPLDLSYPIKATLDDGKLFSTCAVESTGVRIDARSLFDVLNFSERDFLLFCRAPSCIKSVKSLLQTIRPTASSSTTEQLAIYPRKSRRFTTSVPNSLELLTKLTKTTSTDTFWTRNISKPCHFAFGSTINIYPLYTLTRLLESWGQEL
ncbi:hypothetical protein GQ600_22011 [Phytophthora cactorum]|nr:hypothetical protein GQ600_22011 [Phytophthora cactorum]